jgi:hypothetical protein
MSAQSSSAIEQSVDDYYGDDSSDDGNGAYVDPYGAGQSADPYGQSSGVQGSAGTTQTCPATGCSASSCHATQ